MRAHVSLIGISNPSFRNIPENVIKDCKFSATNVLFGINGSGKSTLCQLIADRKVSFKRDDSDQELHTYVFSKEWRKQILGDFEEGGEAPGVLTIVPDKKAGTTKKEIREAEVSLENLRSKKHDILTRIETLKSLLTKAVDAVANGERNTLSTAIPELGARSFNKGHIRKLLENGPGSKLQEHEFNHLQKRATAREPQVSPLPSLSIAWTPSNSLIEALQTPVDTQKSDLEITPWVQQGMREHASGDNCKFCNSIYTADRADRLKAELERIRRMEADFLESGKTQSNRVAKQLEQMRVLVTNLQTTDVDFAEPLKDAAEQCGLKIAEIHDRYRALEAAIQEKILSPGSSTKFHQEEFSLVDSDPILNLIQVHKSTIDSIRRYGETKKAAITSLKRHCCAADGAGFHEPYAQLTAANNELRELEKKEAEAAEALKNLKKDLTGTAATAKFMDQNLRQILRDDSLSVSVRDSGGYSIVRGDNNATAMSEGERKIVALLYFCSFLLEEDRSDTLGDSIVAFDDLGSELDESRLLSIDRFLHDFRTKNRILSVFYFTHSFEYARILQSRFAKQVKEGKAAFWEVHKRPRLGQVSQPNTHLRNWTKEALFASTDYSLSFLLLHQEAVNISKGIPASLAAGNYARKVLEGFTQFKDPATDKFGVRIDRMVTGRKLSHRYSLLPKLTNSVSHSDLDRASLAWSSALVDEAVKQTFSFLREFDEDHLISMLTHLENTSGEQSLADNVIDMILWYDKSMEMPTHA